MRRITAAEVHARKVAELGLDPDALDLTAPEAIAGALRRAASAICPCTPGTLVRSVVRPLRGLVEDLEGVKGAVEEVLEALVALGDLLAEGDVSGEPVSNGGHLLYPAPASFVARESGAVILLGIASDQLSALPDELESRIEYLSHIRRLNPLPGEDLGRTLADFGLIELSEASWLRMPEPESTLQLISRIDGLLDSAAPSGEVPGLVILDPARPTGFYRGRWLQPRAQSGRFVARRPQAYGSDLWSYVRLRLGEPDRLVDFPLQGSLWRGCDDAWRLQLAIDAARDAPQRFRLRPAKHDKVVLELFSPMPMWARRRWDAVGEPVPSSQCLFAYLFTKVELDEEVTFLHDRLWLAPLGEARYLS